MHIGTEHTRRVRVPDASVERPVRHQPVAAPKARTSKKGDPAADERSRSTISRDKRLERERRVRARQWQALLRVALLVGAVVGALALGTWFYRSPVFAIDSVDVMGAKRLTPERVREIAAVPEDATLIRLPAKEIDRRLRAEPWIAEVELHRRWPHTLLIEVVERTPAAVLDVGGSTLWLVDQQGYVLGERPADDTSPLPVIRDVPELAPKPGERLSSDVLANALRVLEGLSGQLRGQVRAISASSVDKTALYTHEDVEIFVGSSEDLARKDLVIRSILEEQRGKVVYINVRTVERPTWRGLETDKQ